MTATTIKRLLTESRERRDGLVPVFGSGLNIQASILDDERPADDWAGLLDRISGDIGLAKQERAKLPHSLLSRWEYFVTRAAEANSIEPYQAELRLQRQVVDGLRRIEGTAGRYTLYREVAEAHFPDLISLNFDRRVALASGREKFSAGPKKPREGRSGATLYRHSHFTAKHGGSVTRVWYPHGDTKRVDTLKLGIRRYGFHLALIREHLGLQDPAWRFSLPWEETLSVQDQLEEAVDTSWVNLFMSRPLLFLGCGLGADEWSLWWLLRLRSDQTPAPEAYYVHVDGCDGAVAACGPAIALKPVRFSSYQHLWDTIRSALV